MDRDKANVMRLRVNRVNLVQRIEPSEVLTKLVKFKVIDKIEAEKISSGRTKEDRARNLIDHLITKEHTQKDWYNQFRNTLQDYNYKDLVVFLDNTIIKKPNFVSRFESQDFEKARKVNDEKDVQNQTNESVKSATNNGNYKFNSSKINNKNSIEKITGISFDEEKLNSIMIKGNYERTISNLQTYSVRSEALIAELAKSNEQDDLKQLDLESTAFISMRKLELLYSLYQNEDSLKNSFFLDTEVASQLINSQYNYVFMKYFKNLYDSFGIDLLRYFKDSFIENMNSVKLTNLRFYENSDDLVKKLCWIFIRNEENELAQELISNYLHYLAANNENTDLNFNASFWKSTVDAQALLLLVKNNLMDFKNSYEVYNNLTKLINHAKNLLIGTQINFGQVYYGISQTTMEEGSFDAAFEWANKALMSIEYQDDLTVDILGHAALCYASKWYLSKAKTLALLSIQIARSKNGKNHPAFIKSLLYYGYYSNEFIQDKSSVFLAKYTLDLAKKIFGFDSLMVAECHKSSSKALMACKQFENDQYLDHAQEAYRIASAYYNLDNPKLMTFQMTLALSYQYKGVQSTNQMEKKNFLQDALELCNKVMNTSKAIFGEISSRNGQICLLMGSIYLYMEKLKEAEKYHLRSLELLEVVLPPNNYHVLFGKSTLGVFYKVIGKIKEASILFQEVVDNLKNDHDKMHQIPWIPTVFEYLVDCYRLMQLNDLANKYHHISLSYANYSSKKTDVIVEMEKEPPQDLHHYVSMFLKN